MPNVYTFFHQSGTKSKSNSRFCPRTMPRGDFDKPSRLETPKRSNFRFLKKSWKFTPREPILKKKWEFYVKTEILAPPVARLMILWGMDRSDHFASPHNRVCQNMTFRWLCGDRNINLFSKILIFTAFWLDLQVPSHSLKDSQRISKTNVEWTLRTAHRSESNIWTNPRDAGCKINPSMQWWGPYALKIVSGGISAHESSKGRKILQKAPKNNIFVWFSTSTCDFPKSILDIKILLPRAPADGLCASPNARVCRYDNLSRL